MFHRVFKEISATIVVPIYAALHVLLSRKQDNFNPATILLISRSHNSWNALLSTKIRCFHRCTFNFSYCYLQTSNSFVFVNINRKKMYWKLFVFIFTYQKRVITNATKINLTDKISKISISLTTLRNHYQIVFAAIKSSIIMITKIIIVCSVYRVWHNF